jgi:hypothetical protein
LRRKFCEQSHRLAQPRLQCLFRLSWFNLLLVAPGSLGSIVMTTGIPDGVLKLAFVPNVIPGLLLKILSVVLIRPSVGDVSRD